VGKGTFSNLMNVRYFASLKKTANMESPRGKALACESPNAVLLQ